MRPVTTTGQFKAIDIPHLVIAPPDPSGWIYHPVCKSYGGQSERFLPPGSVVQEQNGSHRDLVRPCCRYTGEAKATTHPGARPKNKIKAIKSMGWWWVAGPGGRESASLPCRLTCPALPRPR